MRRIQVAFILALCLVAATLVGCDSDEDGTWEERKKALVEKCLDRDPDITYGAVSLDSTNKTMVIDDLKILFKDKRTNSTRVFSGELSAEKLEARGVNFVNSPKGVIDLAESVTLTNVAYTLNDITPEDVAVTKTFEKITGTADEVVIKNPRNNPAIFSSGKLKLLELLADKKGMKVAGYSVKNILCDFSYEQDLIGDIKGLGIDKYMKSMDRIPKDEPKIITHSVGLLNFDRLPLNGAHLSMEKYIQEVEEDIVLSLRNMEVIVKSAPDFFQAAQENATFEDLIKQDIDIDKIEFKDLKAYTDYGTIAVKRIVYSLLKEGDSLNVKNTTENITIPLELLDEVAENSHFTRFSELHNKPLVFSSNWEVDAELKGDELRLDFPSIGFREANLFNIETSFFMDADGVVMTPGGDGPFTAENWYLAKGKAVIQDKGLLDLGFTIAAMEQQKISAREAKDSGKMMRSQVAVFLPSMCVSTLGPSYRNLCDTIGKAVASEGTLRIMLTPSSPLPLDEETLDELLENPEDLGLKGTFTPAR